MVCLCPECPPGQGKVGRTHPKIKTGIMAGFLSSLKNIHKPKDVCACGADVFFSCTVRHARMVVITH